MPYCAGNEGKTVVYNNFLDPSKKNNAKHIAREVQEFLTASQIKNVVSGMLTLCPASAHILSSPHMICSVRVPLCDAAAAA